MMTSLCRYVLFFGIVVGGCQGTGETQRKGAVQEAREPLPGLQVTVRGVALIFDGKATEVAVSFVNRRSEPVTLSGLSGKAKLVLKNGSVLPVHEISVGVEKPILIPGKGSLDTSLLFAGAGRDATKMHLLEAEVPVR
jgi:hypothetical protein